MKINNIKIGLLSIFLILGTQEAYAQSNVGDVVTTPVASPSMASMSQYSDVPISLATGLPDIGISLLNAPISDGGISWPLNLSYNIRNASEFADDEELASDVGSGWSFFGAGVIYKKIIMGLDECYDNAGAVFYQKNEFDDLYYYNLPGLSGKFRIKRDITNNTFSLINLMPNNAKIEYARDSNTATFKADAFTITADNGYKYFFDKADTAKYDCGELIIGGNYYKPSYYLSRILNPLGVEIAAMAYDERTKYSEKGSKSLIFLQNKLKTITSRSGQVVFNYTYDETLEAKKENDKTASDPYSLQKITLKNPAGEELFSYVFNYTMVSKSSTVSNKERILNSVFKNDRNGNLIEKHRFIYSQPSGLGTLKRVISPTGGVTEYNLEYGDRYFNYSDPEYLAYLQQETNISNPEIQYWSSMGNGPIDTNQNLQYTFTMPGDPAVKKKFKFVLDIPEYSYPIPPELPEVPGFPPLPKPRKDNLKIVLKRGSEIIIPQLTITGGMYKEYNLNGYPGTYSLEFVSTGGAVGTGSFNAVEMKLHPGPFRSAMATGYTRIKNIKYYKNTDDTSAYRTIDYGYDSFDLPNSASGYLYDTDRDSESDFMTRYVLYKNVKVSEAGTGMQRYYFKTPDDYPKQQIGGTAQEPQYFWPYYNVTKGGLLSKKEIYNEQNTLLTAELYDYELDKYMDEEYNFNTMGKITSKPSYIKKSNVISKAYFGGNQPVISQTETSMSPLNFQPNYIKETGSSGEIMEKLIYYPKDQSGYAHLGNANITNIPVQTITKNNGKVISNTQLKYDNNKLQPTSAVLINPNDGSLKTAIRYDDYDAQGHLRQYTAVGDESTGKGVTTTVIWGYNNTMPIAEVKGASLTDIGSLADAVIVKSNLDVDAASETELINALDLFRTNPALKNFQITTYTYDPLIGVTTLTPPNGMREIYRYDQQNKLKSVVNVNGNILKEYKYNIKQP